MVDNKEAREYGEELLRRVDEFRHRIVEGTNNPEHFLTISEIEHLWSELRGDTSLLYSDMLSDLLSNADEAALIRKKKRNIEKKV